MPAGVCAGLFPQVALVVGVLRLADHNFPHFPGFRLDQRGRLMLEPARNAPLAAWRITALRASLAFRILFVLAPDRLVQLLAHVKLVEAVVEDVAKIARKPNDVAAEVQKQTVAFVRRQR